jgi:hypothetical protein
MFLYLRKMVSSQKLSVSIMDIDNDAVSFFPLMYSAYNFNLYINATFSGSLEWLLYTGSIVYEMYRIP